MRPRLSAGVHAVSEFHCGKDTTIMSGGNVYLLGWNFQLLVARLGYRFTQDSSNCNQFLMWLRETSWGEKSEPKL